jgi:gluconokinase
VYLRGSSELIARRLAQRHGHYMDPNLLPSQFATLEEPRDAVVVEVNASVAEIVGRIRTGLSL